MVRAMDYHSNDSHQCPILAADLLWDRKWTAYLYLSLTSHPCLNGLSIFYPITKNNKVSCEWGTRMWIIAVTAPKYSEVVTWWTIWFSICKCLVQGSSIVELKEWLWAVSSVYGVTSAIIFWVLTIINEPVRWGVSPMSRSIHYPWVVVKLYSSSNHDRDDDDQGFGSGPSSRHRVQAAVGKLTMYDFHDSTDSFLGKIWYLVNIICPIVILSVYTYSFLF